MIAAFSYARVSSREQEREGYSIPAQRRLLAEYAGSRGFSIKREFVDIESAKNPGRKEFTNMLRLLEADGACRIVLVEKTDRLYRNRTDALAFETLIEERGIEIHLVKEGRVIGKESRSQDKFMHDIHVAVAKHYVENLKEEVKKGMREKAEQGSYPGRAPFGYRNNPLTRTIEIHPVNAQIVTRIFEFYGSGQYSLSELQKAVRYSTGKAISRAYLHTILKNPFYMGQFSWGGNLYRGTHKAFISGDLYKRAQAVLHGHNKPKYGKQEIAFRGLLR